jgi:hypothetical protein
MAEQNQAPKAQSEIGPTSYVEGGEIIQHGADDKETQRAYAAGHPSDGVKDVKDADPAPARAASTEPAAAAEPTAAAPAADKPARKRAPKAKK